MWRTAVGGEPASVSRVVVLTVAAACLFAFAGCSGNESNGPTGQPQLPSPSSFAPSEPTASSAASSAETSETVSPSAKPKTSATAEDVPETDATARPTQPVPSVTPSGVVDPPPGEGMDRYTNQQINWVDCTSDGMQCASVRAPLDYDKPDGKAVTLAVSRKQSTGESQGALFINPGGPGGSGVNYVGYFDGHGLEKAYDIVGWDPRGVGYSTPVQCFDAQELEHYTSSDYSPDNAEEVKELTQLSIDFGQACLQKSGELLQHVSTEETVRDLDLLREVMDQPKLNYFGSSYGTSIGAMYATEFPDKVGRLVLDGATSIGSTPEIRQSDGFERSIGNFAEWCAEENCRLGDSRKEVLTKISSFLDDLDQEPIPGGRRELTQALATSGLVYALYSPEDNYPNLLLGLVNAIEEGDGTVLLLWADRYNQRDPDGDFGQFNAAFPAIRCLDSTDDGVRGAMREWKQVQKTAPTMGQFLGPDLVCATWPVASVGDLDRKIDYDDGPPIMILGTTGDPATPYEYAEQMHKSLKSSRLITLNGDGHLAFDQSSCVQRHVVDYLVDDELSDEDQVCRR